jgi:hypothetical protein
MIALLAEEKTSRLVEKIGLPYASNRLSLRSVRDLFMERRSFIYSEDFLSLPLFLPSRESESAKNRARTNDL